MASAQNTLSVEFIAPARGTSGEISLRRRTEVIRPYSFAFRYTPILWIDSPDLSS